MNRDSDAVRTMVAQHDELRTLVARYRTELARPAPDLAALSDCRWTLLRLVMAHLAFEEAHLFPAVMRRGAAVEAAGRAMKGEVSALFARFQDHVREWTAIRIESDWRAFGEHASTLLNALVARMEREERELYTPLLVAKAA